MQARRQHSLICDTNRSRRRPASWLKTWPVGTRTGMTVLLTCAMTSTSSRSAIAFRRAGRLSRELPPALRERLAQYERPSRFFADARASRAPAPAHMEADTYFASSSGRSLKSMTQRRRGGVWAGVEIFSIEVREQHIRVPRVCRRSRPSLPRDSKTKPIPRTMQPWKAILAFSASRNGIHLSCRQAPRSVEIRVDRDVIGYSLGRMPSTAPRVPQTAAYSRLALAAGQERALDGARDRESIRRHLIEADFPSVALSNGVRRD